MTAPPIVINPGIYPNMPMELYHKLPCASNSRLNKLARSPAHLKAYLEEPDADTKALRIGRAIHTAVLEPDLFSMTFTVADRCEATYKTGARSGERCENAGSIYSAREGWLCGQHKGKQTESDDERTVLAPDAYATALAARDAIYRHPGAKTLLDDAHEKELVVVWADPETGVLCKARYDALTRKFGAIIDLKSCTDASKRAFERTIYARGYDIQGAHYLNGAEANDIPLMHGFVHVAVEKEVPVAAAYRLDDKVVEAGRARLSRLLKMYDRCMTTNEFPGYSDLVEDVSIPAWAWDQIDDELGLRGEV